MRFRIVLPAFALASMLALVNPVAASAPSGAAPLRVDLQLWVSVLETMMSRMAAGLPQPPHDGRVFVSVELYDSNTDVSAHFELPLDGIVSDEVNVALSDFFKCHASGRTRKMNPGLIGLLAQLAQQYPGHVIEIYSAYRGTRAERHTSPHKAGRALDLKVRGVKSTTVRDWLWTTHHEVGVGWYPHHDFVHMDVRPGQKDTSWTQKTMNSENQYNPYWAEKSRRQAAKAEREAAAKASAELAAQ